MALATIHPSRSTFSREPAWDEAIVPALRKRLETESHLLAKRMSAASIDGPDTSLASSSTFASRNRAATPTSSKPSAIPRPSMQQSRTADTSRARSGSFQRNRTVSQPFPFEPLLSQSAPPLPADATSRSSSPMSSSVHSTRIPVSRGRTGSVSSSYQPSLHSVAMNTRGDSRNGHYKTNGAAYGPELATDLWPVAEGRQPSSVSPRSRAKSSQSGAPESVDERSPYNSSSRRGYDDDYPRMSNDSEERPYEHWYRGDVSRNGGVGELRVGKRLEMLDIANYGHTLRQASSRTALSSSSRSRSNSRGRDAAHSRPTTRSRAESVGARESIYLDEDSKLGHGSFVLNERPPTDIDTDEEAYEDEEYYEEDTTAYGGDNGAVSPPHSLDRSDSPTLVDLRPSGFKSRIPTPTSRNPGSRSGTPTSASPPPLEVPPTPKASPPPLSQAAPKPAAATTAAKRKAKGPAATTPAPAKRTKKPPAKPKTTLKKDTRSRESVAQYPAPEGDDVMHAVPSWTQPVPKSGNWDDVVLPVVARKKGLEDHYVPADGTPKPKQRAKRVIEPAPGTFGFDHSKYRGRTDTRDEEILMDDFDQDVDDLAPIDEQQPPPELEPGPQPKVVNKAPMLQAPLSPPPRLSTSPVRPESPAPFSQYIAPVPIPEIRVIRASSDNRPRSEVGEEDESRGGGCCKCVIM